MDGLLFRQWRRGKLEQASQINCENRLCVPSKFRVKLLGLAHRDNISSGHGERKRTSEILSRHFYWPNISLDIKNFVASCDVCQKVGRNRDVKRAAMMQVPIIEEPWSRVICDLTGPMNETNVGYRYIVSVVCAATRYVEATAIKSAETEEVAGALIEIFSRLGYPKEIGTDQGREFVSRLIEQLWRLTGVKHRVGSAYHPESQAIVERYHETLKQGLRAMLVEFPDLTWDKTLPYVLFTIRSTENRSTGFSPGQLMFGREFRAPLSLVREQWENGLLPGETPVAYVIDVLEKQAAALKLAGEKQKVESQKRKEYYDKNTCSREFKEGDEVMTLRHDRKHKLQCLWAGPYKIVKRLSPVNYILENKPGKHKLLHINQLKALE